MRDNWWVGVCVCVWVSRENYRRAGWGGRWSRELSRLKIILPRPGMDFVFEARLDCCSL